MDLRVPLISDELKAAGYATHMLGKWHLGFRTQANIPTSRGFDSFFGLLAGGADHYNKALEACGGEGANCSCGSRHSTALPFRIDMWDSREGGPAKELWDETTFDGYQYAARAVELVQTHDRSRPFFLYWAPHKVHSPLQCAPEFLAHYPADPGGRCTSTPDTCEARGYGTAGAGCGCKQMCYCNRRIIKGMVSAVDAMLRNLTLALKTTGMYSNTVFVFLGDNGAPNNNAGSNDMFKGMKFSHWEGGHRVPAFIAGPAVAAGLAGGRWYNGTVHLVDLHATILELAGVAAAAHPHGVNPVDGLSLVGVLNGSIGPEEQVRHELWIADDVLRIGDWKLLTGAGAGPTTCMLGINGLPVRTANNPRDLSTTCGAGHCASATGVDAEICWGCKCPSYNLTDPNCRPCLYDVSLDPGEFTNLASRYPDKVAEMTARLAELAAGKAPPSGFPIYPPNDIESACQAMVEAGGFFVPWAAPPPPPAPPLHPISAESIAGRWAMNHDLPDQFDVTITTNPVAQPGEAFALQFDGCPGCCWTRAEGTATPVNRSAGGGGIISVVGYGAGCDSNRTCTGAVFGVAGTIEIAWQCTCHTPARSCGAFGARPWVKLLDNTGASPGAVHYSVAHE